MKKTLIAFAVATAFASAASAASFKAGTYTATAPGIHGDVTVEVTFTADKLADIKVTKQSEKPSPTASSRPASIPPTSFRSPSRRPAARRRLKPTWSSWAAAVPACPPRSAAA